jgi:hypothetical protein
MQLSKNKSFLAMAGGVMSLASLTQMASADTYQSGQTGQSALDFTAKSTTTTTTKTGHEPMDLIQIVDLSGSLSDGEFKSRFGYAGRVANN